MKISFNWLKQFVDLPDSTTAQEVADKLKMSTVEVEGVEIQGKDLANIVIGKVLKIEKHPNADKLQVCTVDVGNEQITIVCGGSNVSEGMTTVVAKNGSKVKWHGEGDLIELKPTVIRGVESNGMICASDEVGMPEMFPKSSEKEIIDIKNATFKPGTPVAEAFGMNDAILEIDNKSLSNRPDLWGHYGIAREVAALFHREVKPYEIKEIGSQKQEIKVSADVQVPVLCPRYTAVALGGIVVAESPRWLKDRLIAAGQRPINNIVDITNYVMLEIGQPTHAFDVRYLSGKNDPRKKIQMVVRQAGQTEKFTTLDGQERQLSDTMFVIADEEKAVALGGIMGGKNSEIKPDTTTILFESANFESTVVRKTSTALGLRTEGSARWEKSQDPANALIGLNKLVALTLEVVPSAYVVSNVVNVGKERSYSPKIEIPVTFFAEKIGLNIPTKTIVSILTRLGFGVVEKKKDLIVAVPSWRATKDVSIAEDVVEEVLRMYGYENVPLTMPTFPITPPVTNTLRNLEHAVSETMVRDLAYTEVYNYSFVSSEQIKRSLDNVELYLELDNPISKEKPFLRRNLLLNLLENVDKNLAGAEKLKLFEIGKIYLGEEAGPRVSETSDELLPRQDTWMGALYLDKKDHAPFWEAKRVAETLGKNLGINCVFVATAKEMLAPYQHPARAAQIMAGDKVVGRVWELHPTVAENFGLMVRVALCGINLSLLDELKVVGSNVVYKSSLLYPGVSRDIAFVIDKNITHVSVAGALQNIDALLKNVELFDVFSGKNMVEGKKSMAYRLTFASGERTLKTEEVDVVMKKVEGVLKEKFGAEVR